MIIVRIKGNICIFTYDLIKSKQITNTWDCMTLLAYYKVM